MSNPAVTFAFVAQPAWHSPVGMGCCSMGMWAAYAYAWQRAQRLAAEAAKPRFDPSWN